MKIINIMASSLDGRIGVHSVEGDQARQRVGLSNREDHRRLLAEMAAADAIVVGASSIRANEACLDHWQSPLIQNRETLALERPYPHWYIFTRSPLPQNYLFWQQTHIPRTLISRSSIDQGLVASDQRIENLCYGEQNSMSRSDIAVFATEILRSRQHERVLLFGGGVINSWFYQAGLVDELMLTLAPVMVGQEAAPYLLNPSLSEVARFKLMHVDQDSSFLFLHYEVL